MADMYVTNQRDYQQFGLRLNDFDKIARLASKQIDGDLKAVLSDSNQNVASIDSKADKMRVMCSSRLNIVAPSRRTSRRSFVSWNSLKFQTASDQGEDWDLVLTVKWELLTPKNQGMPRDHHLPGRGTHSLNLSSWSLGDMTSGRFWAKKCVSSVGIDRSSQDRSTLFMEETLDPDELEKHQPPAVELDDATPERMTIRWV